MFFVFFFVVPANYKQSSFISCVDVLVFGVNFYRSHIEFVLSEIGGRHLKKVWFLICVMCAWRVNGECKSGFAIYKK